MLKLTDEDFNRLVAYMKKNYGINLDKKRILIEGRLSNMVTQRGKRNHAACKQAYHKPHFLHA